MALQNALTCRDFSKMWRPNQRSIASALHDLKLARCRYCLGFLRGTTDHRTLTCWILSRCLTNNAFKLELISVIFDDHLYFADLALCDFLGGTMWKFPAAQHDLKATAFCVEHVRWSLNQGWKSSITRIANPTFWKVDIEFLTSLLAR